MKKRVAPFVENISEATAACLVTMVQGNVLALGLGHWIIASQTGIAAGTITAAIILIAKAHRRWVISLLLGLITAIVDFYIHPGMFESVILEAVITGIGAAVLSFAAGLVLARLRSRRAIVD